MRAYLETLIPASEEIERMTAGTGADLVHPNRGRTYDSELGFVHAQSIHRGDGVNGTSTLYDYEADGARRLVHCADRPCRIHTYGNSFTHCDQVNDGETWQEQIAAHLQEPVRNYGVGGYSVYQAYRRMRKVHGEGRRAEYIILNIYDDDHYRNLVRWRQRPHAGPRPAAAARSAPTFPSFPTRPHLRVDVSAGSHVEVDNAITTADDLVKLRDLDFLCAEFGEDPLLYLSLARESEGDQAVALVERACEHFGLPMPSSASENIDAAIDDVFTQAALFSTRPVVELVEQFCKAEGIVLMFILSYSSPTIGTVLDGGDRFDLGFVDWLKGRSHPVVDMCDTFNREFKHSTVDLDDFVKRYYIGHHTPFGNAYTAWTVMEVLVDLLDPKPLPYQSGVGN